MTKETRKRRWRWLRHVAWVLGIKVFLIALGLAIFFGSGAGNPLLRRALIHRLESMMHGKVEVRDVSIQWLSLTATLKGVVIHGREPEGTEALFAADEITAGLRVDSFWGRQISLDELYVTHPQIHVRVEKDGRTNLPVMDASMNAKRWRETLFDLHARKAALRDGWILYNDVKIPLSVEGGELKLSVDGGGTREHPLYVFSVDWQAIQLTQGRNLTVPVGVKAKVSLWRAGLTVEQCTVTAGRSRVDLQAEMNGFSGADWKVKYRGWLDLTDIRQTFRAPRTLAGTADIHGETTYAAGKTRSQGEFSAQKLTFTYEDFHASGLAARGEFTADNSGVTVTNLVAQAFGGTVTSRVEAKYDGWQFRADTKVRGVKLAELLPALEQQSFPVNELHWDALISADTTETWTTTFQNFEVVGTSNWGQPDDLAPGHLPVSGEWRFRYRHEPRLLTLTSGQFETPNSRGSASGTLGARGSSLEVRFEAGSLESYDDFFQQLQGPSENGEARHIAGSARWDGTLQGAAGRPTFSGHARGERLRYGNVSLDSADADVTYSPEELTIARGRARHGVTEAEIEGTLELADWEFLPGNGWSGDASFDKTPLDSLQELAGTSYAVHGILSGQFHGKGTREEPAVTGLFDLAEGTVYGVGFNRLRGQISASREEVRVTNAELRVFAPGKENGRGAGIVTGSVGYRLADKTISAELVGAALPLENFEKLQMKSLPIGGQATFRLKASGPASAPLVDGTIRVVDLKLGQEVIGSFDGKLTSNGSEARLELSSAMNTGEISGGYTVGLAEPYPIHGTVSIRGIDLDPVFLNLLHVEHFSGHGSATGDISLSGSLKPSENLVVEAKLSSVVLNYANVRLENAGPIHFRSSKGEFQIDHATLKGPDTNLEVEGNVLFSGRRTVAMKLNGTLDLRLLSGLAPGLDARGPAQINATFGGTIDRPRITGRVHIENASARAADFPTGLSAIKGDLVFDATRLFFENVTAEAGGGTLTLTGSVNYADRPIRFDVSVRTPGVRIRYPEGMSWLAAGSLRLTGTPEGGLLSGRVTVERVTLTQGLDTAGVLISAKEGTGGPSTQSTFLRNLQFDIEGLSTPDARMEWPGAQLEAEANLRVRGTWEHPILLGHIHILSGDLYFHGNRYNVARGDLNFSNPFRLDPVLNVEATTTVQQYEITLNFNGPASKLTLAYRSDPPLPANDVITLLALGQTSSEAEVRGGGTGVSQSAGSGASAILSEAISSQLGGRLEKLFGITRFRVDPGLAGVGSTGSEQNAAARVTVEQQIARNLTITYVSNVSSTQQQVIQVEYNVNRNVSIVGLRDQNGTFGIDVKIKKRFP